jgi:hypothetical protein
VRHQHIKTLPASGCQTVWISGDAVVTNCNAGRGSKRVNSSCAS